MDCCNYVHQQSYASQHGVNNFYHYNPPQQHEHQYCSSSSSSYENQNSYANAYCGGSGNVPIRGASQLAAIEAASSRYSNCRLPPAYPTDYVYNPKEARIRKALRDQSREISRHQGPVSSSVAQEMPAVSSLGMMSPNSHGTLGQTKELIRKQLECSSASNYQNSLYAGNDYATIHHHHHHSTHNHHHQHQESRDYCGSVVNDFVDGQKWHPYQNGTNSYHCRGAIVSKMNVNNIHRGIQPSNVNCPSSPWGPFCNVPPTSNQNVMMRDSRQLVYQQDQQRVHNFPAEDISHPSYERNEKMNNDVNSGFRTGYGQDDNQPKSPMSPLQLTQSDSKSDDNNSTWGTSRPPSSISTSSCATDIQDFETTQSFSNAQRIKQHQYQQNQQKSQPLPGFQQAFGSTEIGKFSRSELFASLMINEATSAGNNVSSISNVNIINRQDEDSDDGLRSSPEIQNNRPRWHSPYIGAIGSEN